MSIAYHEIRPADASAMVLSRVAVQDAGMAEIITLAFFFSVWIASAALGWLLRRYAPGAVLQRRHVATAALVTATLGSIALWLAFTISGVTAAG
jgi:hypothetical protein